jgi:hypothetical protein
MISVGISENLNYLCIRRMNYDGSETGNTTVRNSSRPLEIQDGAGLRG